MASMRAKSLLLIALAVTSLVVGSEAQHAAAARRRKQASHMQQALLSDDEIAGSDPAPPRGFEDLAEQGGILSAKARRRSALTAQAEGVELPPPEPSHHAYEKHYPEWYAEQQRLEQERLNQQQQAAVQKPQKSEKVSYLEIGQHFMWGMLCALGGTLACVALVLGIAGYALGLFKLPRNSVPSLRSVLFRMHAVAIRLRRMLKASHRHAVDREPSLPSHTSYRSHGLLSQEASAWASSMGPVSASSSAMHMMRRH